MRAHKESLKIGTRQDCAILAPKGEKSGEKVAEIFRLIISQSDFIICHINGGRQNLTEGVDAVFDQVKKEMLTYRDEIIKINPSIEIFLESGWPSKDTFSGANAKNLVKYWKLVDQWAHQVNIKALMFEALDSPWKQWSLRAAHFGWWRLQRNEHASNKLGYAEKIAGIPMDEEVLATTNFLAYVVLSIAFCLIIGLVLILYFRVNRLQNILSKQEIHEFMNGISSENVLALAKENGEVESALRFPYSKKTFEISKDQINIKPSNLLGFGQFGCVYEAIVETKPGVMTEAAVKMSKSCCSGKELKSLLFEIKILTYLGNHSNIVSIVGAYTGELEKGIVYVITEICKMGSLQDYLRNEQFADANGQDNYMNVQAARLANDTDAVYTNQRSITLKLLMTWAHEIACGMEYLGNKNVVHADLATRNVLLTMEKTAKISDFGLSRRLYEYSNYVKRQQEPLPWKWMAKESLKKLQFSSATDVWSYGVTLWEIFSLGDLPFPGLSWSLDFVDKLENGLRMISPRYSTPEMFQIMSQCWAENPNQRPTFAVLRIITGELITRRDFNDC